MGTPAFRFISIETSCPARALATGGEIFDASLTDAECNAVHGHRKKRIHKRRLVFQSFHVADFDNNFFTRQNVSDRLRKTFGLS
jgi:hypothetical protein